jgi:hypothetical protein
MSEQQKVSGASALLSIMVPLIGGQQTLTMEGKTLNLHVQDTIRPYSTHHFTWLFLIYSLHIKNKIDYITLQSSHSNLKNFIYENPMIKVKNKQKMDTINSRNYPKGNTEKEK